MRQIQFHGVQQYCPMRKVKRVNPRAQTWVPYFPGYLFVKCDLEEIGLSFLQNMPGAVGPVEFGGEAATVTDEVVESIKQKIDQLEGKDAAIIEQIKPGERIRLQTGVFSGYEAIFDLHLPGTERARVLLKLIKDRFVRLEVPLGHIQKI